MAALPRAVADPLPADLIELNTPATEVAPGRIRTRGRDLTCRAVVVAADPPAATTLLPNLQRVRMHSYTTYHHSTDTRPWPNRSCYSTGTAGNWSPTRWCPATPHPRTRRPGGTRWRRPAGPARAADPPRTGPAVRAFHRRVDPPHHRLRAGGATPTGPPPQGRLCKPVAFGDGLFVAGDHRDSPSIQGALASGWRTAGAVLAELRAAGCTAPSTTRSPPRGPPPRWTPGGDPPSPAWQRRATGCALLFSHCPPYRPIIATGPFGGGR